MIWKSNTNLKLKIQIMSRTSHSIHFEKSMLSHEFNTFAPEHELTRILMVSKMTDHEKTLFF